MQTSMHKRTIMQGTMTAMKKPAAGIGSKIDLDGLP